MRRYVASQLRLRPGRALALGLGIVVAAVSFTLLTAAATTSELQIRGGVRESFRAAYDILARPADSFTDLERERGLVRANYLGGLHGGITRDDYETVRAIAGVEVAAPIANIGYVLPYAEIPVTLDGLLDGSGVELYRLRLDWVSDRGASRYPVGDRYVYVTSRNPFLALDEQGREVAPSRGQLHELVPGVDDPLPVCSRFGFDATGAPRPETRGPRPPLLSCFSTVTPEVAQGLEPGVVGTIVTLRPPILLSAVDPEEEAALVGIDGTITTGRYLAPGEPAAPGAVRSEPPSFVDLVPVIASDRSYVDARLEADVEQLPVPDPAEVPRILADYDRAYDWLVDLPGEPVAERSVEPGPVYAELLDGLAGEPSWDNLLSGYWQAGEVRYETLDEGEPPGLRPRATAHDPSTWSVPRAPESSGPPGSGDVQFRPLDVFGALADVDTDEDGNDHYRGAGVRVVGTFDPELLGGFDPLGEVPLETYHPPSAAPADEASAAALGGEPLLPSMNLGGYLAQPPLMLTTLEAAEAFFGTEDYEGSSTAAPISAIRIRVAGVEGPDPVSLERIRRVGEAIVDATGLAVDVTAGSSPTPVRIALAPGEYGRPELSLEEGWVQKGVAVAVLTAVDRKSAVLFVLILVACAAFLANGALASVRSRRREIATLRALGWTQAQVFRATLAELLAVGAAAGIAGTGIAAGVILVADLQFPLVRTLLVAPVAVLLAAVAGTFPALTAARTEPVQALAGPGSTRTSKRPVRGLAGMAARTLLRLPSRTLVGVFGLALAVAMLVVLLAVSVGFEGVLTGTLLGDALAVRVRPVDYATTGLALLLGASSVADTLYVSLRERAADFVTLRSSGWHERTLIRLGLWEAGGLGLSGAVLGTAVGLALAGVLGGELPPAVLGLAAATAAGGLTLTLVACVVPLCALSRMTPATVLAEE